MKIATDVADALCALDPPVFNIVEAMIRRRLAGDKTAKVVIPCRTSDGGHFRPNFSSSKITAARGRDLIPVDIDGFFNELRQTHAGWQLKGHQRKWVEGWTVTDPLAWAALKPYAPDERRAILYAAMPNHDFAFGLGDIMIAKRPQNWMDVDRNGYQLHVVARQKTPAYDWKEGVLTVKGLTETIVYGLVDKSPPLRDIIDMGDGFDAEVQRYAASRHAKAPCLKIYLKPIHKSLDDDAP